MSVKAPSAEAAAQSSGPPKSVASRAAGELFSALALSLLSKIVTFSLTALIVRRVTAETKGVSFSMEVYVSSALFLGKEAIRSVNARRDFNPHDAQSVARTANYAFCAVPLGLAVALGCIAHIIHSGGTLLDALCTATRWSQRAALPSRNNLAVLWWSGAGTVGGALPGCVPSTIFAAPPHRC